MTAETVNTFRLGLTHAHYQFLDRIRSPFSLVLGLGAPVMTFTFFIVPQRALANDPGIATAALVAFCVFAVMANSLFGFAVEIAQNREKTWGVFLKSLPGSVLSRLLGYVLSAGSLAILSIIPLLVVAFLTTEARIDAKFWMPGLITLVLTSAPFMLISAAIGFIVSARTSVAIVQVLMLGLAFAGGLFMPPSAFPPWLDLVSTLLPSRSALELSLWAATGGSFPINHALIWLVWMIISLAAALACATWDRTRRESR